MALFADYPEWFLLVVAGRLSCDCSKQNISCGYCLAICPPIGCRYQQRTWYH